MTGAAGKLGAVIAQTGGGVDLRFWWVAAVNAGPPKTLDLALTHADAVATPPVIAIAGARYSASYAVLVPAQGDGVMVLGSLPGGSSRTGGRSHGGWYFVVDKVAF